MDKLGYNVRSLFYKKNEYSGVVRLREWVKATTFFGSLVAVLFLITFSIFAGVNHSTHVSCKALGELTGEETRVFGPKADPVCYVNLDGRWVPASTWVQNTGN